MRDEVPASPNVYRPRPGDLFMHADVHLAANKPYYEFLENEGDGIAKMRHLFTGKEESILLSQHRALNLKDAISLVLRVRPSKIISHMERDCVQSLIRPK